MDDVKAIIFDVGISYPTEGDGEIEDDRGAQAAGMQTR